MLKAFFPGGRKFLLETITGKCFSFMVVWVRITNGINHRVIKNSERRS